MYVSVITLSTKDNKNLTEQLDEEFRRSVYWNEYKSKIETKTADDNNVTRFPLDASFQDVNRLFFLAFDNTENGNKKVERDSHRKHFLPRVNITNYNVLSDGRHFYDQPINETNQIKKYYEIRKIVTEKGHNCATGCLLGYQYFKDHYQLTAVALSKQKELDADSKANQQIKFYGTLGTKSQACTVFKKNQKKLY